MNIVRHEAIQLVDNVLEQSIFIINSQQSSSNTMHSESEHFAITCDVNGVDLIKSPTIESMSGRSFDDNFSMQDVDVDMPTNVMNYSNSCSKLVHDTNECHNSIDTKHTLDRNKRKFDKLSSQLDNEYKFDHAMAQNNDEEGVIHFQCDLLKSSMDDCGLSTAADLGAHIPDNDLQDLSRGDCFAKKKKQTEKERKNRNEKKQKFERKI